MRASKDLEALVPHGTTRRLGTALEFMRALWDVNHGLESTSRRMKRRLGVTGPERMVLRLVGRYPGITAGGLAGILHVHPSTLTALLKRLVRRGLLVRGTDARDARKALFTLTAKGRAIDAVKAGTVEAAVQKALHALAPEDVATTVAALEVVARVLER